MTNSVENLEAMSDTCFEQIVKLIHVLTGITISQSRKTMIQGRVRKRVVALGLTSYDEYYLKVMSCAIEKINFIDAVTTNETYFYRTPRVWEYITDKFLKQWFTENDKKTFYAWSAAASSGEEASTLGILLQSFKDQNPGFQYQILGTDISREMVQICQKGAYQGRSIESFQKAKPELFKKYMIEDSAGCFSVLPEIKSRIHFKEHNLFNTLPSPNKFDLVLLRNVLIYFVSLDQEKVLSLVHSKLSEKGVLIIGESETLMHIRTEFRSFEPLIYQKSIIKSQGMGA